ncbi:NAD(P) transhydrogenase beta subunit-domain-containing protein, partial [Ochromonadaceae sp. CCMP2298]
MHSTAVVLSLLALLSQSHALRLPQLPGIQWVRDMRVASTEVLSSRTSRKLSFPNMPNINIFNKKEASSLSPNPLQTSWQPTPYAALTVGVPCEVNSGELRVGQSPDSVASLVKAGFSVVVESGAGKGARFTDAMYEEAGAVVVGREVWRVADVIIKVQPPTPREARRLKVKVLVSFLSPAYNGPLVTELSRRSNTVFAMDLIPRTLSRGQAFDALSSQANVAGYRSVIEAANQYPRLLSGQITAAGKIPPAKVLVLGAGVAGLAAVGTARSMGASVRAYDVRPVVQEQVESMGATFLKVEMPADLAEDGSGQGGYAKEMSDRYKEFETASVSRWVSESDIIITTALIPGRPAPQLISSQMLQGMRPGSVVLDMAAAPGGGNCAGSKPNEVVSDESGVTLIGYTDLPSRAATTASQLYGNNAAKFLLSAGPTTSKQQGMFYPDYNDPAVRGMLVMDQGVMTWPNPNPYQPPALKAAPPAPTPVLVAPPKPDPPAVTMQSAQRSERIVSSVASRIRNYVAPTSNPAPATPAPVSPVVIPDPVPVVAVVEVVEAVPEGFLMPFFTSPNVPPKVLQPYKDAALYGSAAAVALVYAGAVSPDASFSALLGVFLLSSFAGQQAVLNVKPALHSPLMAVTNAISGLTAVGGISLLGAAEGSDYTRTLGALAAFLSFVNVFGGFKVAAKMLDLFKRKDAPRDEFFEYYAVPLAVALGGLGWATVGGAEQAGPVVGSAGAVACIAAIGSLSNQKTARLGNVLGAGGVATVVGATMASEWTAHAALGTYGLEFAQVGVLAVAGGAVGLRLADKVGPTELPQAVASFHSLVGTAAVLTAVGEYASEGYMSGGQLFATFAATFIGAITATGSLVAYAKLSGLLPSKVDIPYKDTLNAFLLACILAIGQDSFHTDLTEGHAYTVYALAGLSGTLGAVLTASVGAADTPVVITLLNSYSGWALCAEGFLLQNPLLTSVGALVGFSGAILTKSMCDSMNRGVLAVILGGGKSKKTNKTNSAPTPSPVHGPVDPMSVEFQSKPVQQVYVEAKSVVGAGLQVGPVDPFSVYVPTPTPTPTPVPAATVAVPSNVIAATPAPAPAAKAQAKPSFTEIDPQGAALALKSAKRVVIVPGYGLAVARAQFIVADIVKDLQRRGVDVRIAVHPVAG